MLSKNSFLFRVYCIIISKCRLGCFVFLRLYWVFIKGAISVGSKQVAVCDILIFKNIAFFVIACCVCFERVFDWEILDCFFWLFDVILFWLFIERLCFMRKKKNYGRTVHCKLPLLNPVSKWVRSDSNGWSFNLGVYCLLWKRFCVLNVALRMTKKLNRLRNSDGYVLVFKKTRRVVRPCFNCVDFMAQTVVA